MKLSHQQRPKILNPIALVLILIGQAIPMRAQLIISIDQVIEQTTQNNPQFKVSYQSLEFSKGSYRIARSPFNTNLLLKGENNRERSPISLEKPTVENPTTYLIDSYWGASLAASKKLAFGTVVTPSLGLFNTGQDGLYEQLGYKLANQAGAYLTIDQPLLRGLGSNYNTAELRVAELDINSQEHRYFFDASFLLVDALSAYIEYISAKQNLQIQLDTEESMTETVRQMTRLVELDALPGSELVVSQANLANQQVNTALAQNRLALSMNSLATTIGLSLEELKAMGEAPVDFPFSITAVNIDDNYTESWIAESFNRRHDFLAIMNEQKASEIRLDFSKQGMRPKLNLRMGAGYNGLYESQNFQQFYRPFVSNIPGMNYNIGLTLDIAPRYDREKGLRIQALALNEAANANLEYLRLQIQKEVRRDCDQLKYLLGATENVFQTVELTNKALENEKKKLELGFSTAFNVALMQNRYLDALERQNGLLEQLNRAILQFKYHTGTLVNANDNATFNVTTGELFLLPDVP